MGSRNEEALLRGWGGQSFGSKSYYRQTGTLVLAPTTDPDKYKDEKNSLWNYDRREIIMKGEVNYCEQN